MGTYTRTKKTYYTIAFGNIRRYEEGGGTSEFSGVDGYFKNITERKREVKGEEKTFLDFNFVDGNENFCISCEKFSNTANSILRSLATVTDFEKKILIETWSSEKDGRTYTNVSVKQDGNRVSWVDIPPVEVYKIQTGETCKSTLKRDQFLEALAEKINVAAGAGPQNADASQENMGPEPQEDKPGQDAGAQYYEPGGPEGGNYYPSYVPNAGE